VRFVDAKLPFGGLPRADRDAGGRLPSGEKGTAKQGILLASVLAVGAAAAVAAVDAVTFMGSGTVGLAPGTTALAAAGTAALALAPNTAVTAV